MGVLIRDEQTMIGLAYRSAIDINYTGELNIDGIAPVLQPLFDGSFYTSAITTKTRFPEIYSLGVSYRLSIRNIQRTIC